MADDSYNGVTPNLPPELMTENLKSKISTDGVEMNFDWSKLLFNREEKAQITTKMAQEVAKGLYDVTPYDANDPGFKNGSTTKKLFGKNVKHLREGITFQPNQFIDGSTQVGFKRGYYPVAIWTDRGTINQTGKWYLEDYAGNLPVDKTFEVAFATAQKIWEAKHS